MDVLHLAGSRHRLLRQLLQTHPNRATSFAVGISWRRTNKFGNCSNV
jgi:hypothetical protein